jgi:hypothetical protein
MKNFEVEILFWEIHDAEIKPFNNFPPTSKVNEKCPTDYWAFRSLLRFEGINFAAALEAFNDQRSSITVKHISENICNDRKLTKNGWLHANIEWANNDGFLSSNHRW